MKTLLGTHLDYKISKDANIGGTILKLKERPLTPKVNAGDEPISNTMIGLDGGFKKWKKENRQISNKIINFSKTNYLGKEINTLVIDKDKIDENINKNEFIVIDARSRDRFEGKVPDPRKNVRSGSIPNSVCLPFINVLNNDNSFKNVEELKNMFDKTLINSMDKPVFSCGSGVTACVLALAYSMVNANYLPVIYDGSWAEYGKI